MTPDAPDRPPRLGPLGRRLVLAFSLVSLVTVGLMAVAAQHAVDRGLVASRVAGLWSLADDVADLAAEAYVAQGSWAGADLGPALAAAEAAGARATVTDLQGEVLSGPTGPGNGAQHAAGTTTDVTVGSTVVGTVRVGLQGTTAAGAAARAEARGRELAWSWIVAAALLALACAVAAGWWVTRWLTGPLSSVAAAAHAFARGEHGARAPALGVGELGDLARSFNDAVSSAERSSRARRQMAADVAHELRTPLTALQASLEELRDGLAPADAGALTRLHDQTLRLGRVVADLSVLAEAQASWTGPARGRTDLAAVVRAEIGARSAELRAAGIEVGTVDLTSVEVVADSDRVHQVIGNLLANVARHCRPGDRVDLHLSTEGDRAVLAVSDTGPGIAPADLPKVFDRYWRGPEQRVAGSGLGLAVVREIVEAHRGAVHVGAGAGPGGTTVRVSLPLAPR